MVNPSTDVVVVGGGLVGAACGDELARDGLWVTLFDRHDVGRATDAGAGILSPETYGGRRPRRSSILPTPPASTTGALVPALAELGVPDPRYDVCGTLRVGFREGDDEGVRRDYRRRGRAQSRRARTRLRRRSSRDLPAARPDPPRTVQPARRARRRSLDGGPARVRGPLARSGLAQRDRAACGGARPRLVAVESANRDGQFVAQP